MTSFSFERDKELKNWQIFQDGNETFALPSNWESSIEGKSLMLKPINNAGDNEGLTFTRFDREGHKNQEDDMLAQKSARADFAGFDIQGGDSLKKMIFLKDFSYERSADVVRDGNQYKAYRLVYVGDSIFYHYDIIVSRKRLSTYKGSLLADIIGNLKINREYILRSDNPLKKILNIKI